MSAACETLAAAATNGAGPALRAVDCLANEMASAAFGRLFAPGGVLLPALLSLLTIYIAVFAIALLTGRSRIGIGALTPKMILLGMVLTFATSWIAYQSVIWNLAVGAPDQLAGILMGTTGSATQVFGNRIDVLFQAIATAAENAGNIAVQNAANGGAAPTAGQVAGQTPTSLMWMGALLLLLGTVGVLVTSRIALAVLLALGPVFLVMALFSGTRGLFVGWLRGLVVTAITPLFVVAGGSLTLELALPVVNTLLGEDGISGPAAIGLFMVACVHMALMLMALRVSSTMAAAWSVFGLAREDADRTPTATAYSAPMLTPAAALAATAAATAPGAAFAGQRRTVAIGPLAVASPDGNEAPAQPGGPRTSRTIVRQEQLGGSGSAPPLPPRRARGIGSRFRTPQYREMIR